MIFIDISIFVLSHIHLGGCPPQSPRYRKQRNGLRKKGFGECLQEYTCEQAEKSNFSMDIG